MSKKGNKKKSIQLGMPHGTATNRLRKKILFSLIQNAGLDNCFQCGKIIEKIDNLSIEHKIPWLNSSNPTGLFFDLDNIAFSHLFCNIANATKINQGNKAPHGTTTRYNVHACRCVKCREANMKHQRQWRKKNKLM